MYVGACKYAPTPNGCNVHFTTHTPLVGRPRERERERERDPVRNGAPTAAPLPSPSDPPHLLCRQLFPSVDGEVDAPVRQVKRMYPSGPLRVPLSALDRLDDFRVDREYSQRLLLYSARGVFSPPCLGLRGGSSHCSDSTSSTTRETYPTAAESSSAVSPPPRPSPTPPGRGSGRGTPILRPWSR